MNCFTTTALRIKRKETRLSSEGSRGRESNLKVPSFSGCESARVRAQLFGMVVRIGPRDKAASDCAAVHGFVGMVFAI
jgi:hypothetical protein